MARVALIGLAAATLAVLGAPDRSPGALGAVAAGGAVRILYSSTWTGTHQIYTVDPSRRAATGQLTFGVGGATTATPSPDGRRLAYLGTVRSLFLARANGTGRKRLAPDRVTRVLWSPDSSRLAYERDLRLHVVRADGSDDRVVRRAPQWAAVDPDISSDGRWEVAYSPGAIEISSRPPKTTYSFPARSVVEHRWSPDSRFLAFVTATPGDAGISLVDVRTGRMRSLTGSYGRVLEWAPDATSLAFIAGRGRWEDQFESGDLMVVTLAGRLSTIVDDDRAYGGRIVDLAWTRPPAGIRYRPAEPVPTDRLLAGGPITRLAADGGRVAFSACTRVYAWTPGNGELTPVGHTVSLASCLYRTNTGVHSLAVAGDRVAYGERVGCHSITVTLYLEVLAPTRRSIELARGRGVCASPHRPGVHRLVGSKRLLVFTTVHEDFQADGRCCYTTLEQINRVEEDGCPCPVIASSPGPLAPADVDGDRIVAFGDNATLVLDRNGKPLLSIAASPMAAQLSSGDLVLLLRGQLRVYAATGGLQHAWPLPDVPSGGTCDLQCGRGGDNSRLRLQDLAHGLAAYVLDGDVHVLRLADGADAIVGRGAHARFLDAGLVYADGSRLRLVPFDRLPLR